MATRKKPAWFTDDIREIRDPVTMRALAHPTRLALIEVLTVHGAMTATQASEYVGESPSSCSFHLRTLAKHGFVEETGGGTGRQRPWRVVKLGTSVETGGDAGTKAAGEALVEMYMDRQFARFRRARAEAGSLPKPWRNTTSSNETVAWLTPAEAQALKDELMTLMMRHRERLTDPSLRPEGSRPVETLLLSFPADFTAPPPA